MKTDSFRMIKDRGIDALVNECLIGPVLSMGATFIAYACALLAYLYLIFTSPAYNSEGAYTPVVVAFAFLIGLQICKSSSYVGKAHTNPSQATSSPRLLAAASIPSLSQWPGIPRFSCASTQTSTTA